MDFGMGGWVIGQDLLWLGPTVSRPPVARTYCGSDLLWLGPPVARTSCGSDLLWLGPPVARTYCGSDLLWLGPTVARTYCSLDLLCPDLLTQQISSQTQEVPSCFSLLLVVKQIARNYKITSALTPYGGLINGVGALSLGEYLTTQVDGRCAPHLASLLQVQTRCHSGSKQAQNKCVLRKCSSSSKEVHFKRCAYYVPPTDLGMSQSYCFGNSLLGQSLLRSAVGKTHVCS